MKLLSSTRWQCLFDFRIFNAVDIAVMSECSIFFSLGLFKLKEEKETKQLQL